MGIAFDVYLTRDAEGFGRTPRPGINAQDTDEDFTHEDVDRLLKMAGTDHPLFGQFTDIYDDHIFEPAELPALLVACKALRPSDARDSVLVDRLLRLATLAQQESMTLFFFGP